MFIGLGFDTPAEWFGEPGRRFRKGLSWKPPSAEFLKAWEQFQKRYSTLTLNDLDALYRSEVMG